MKISDYEKKIITIPNLLSMFRVLLVPVFIMFYFWDSLPNHFYYAIGVLALSGFSDILDGNIARKYNMISSFGKIIDPFADKLTQGSAVICMSIRHRILVPLLILFCAKEFTMLLCSIRLLKMGARPSESKWWGKLSTVMMFVFIVFTLTTDIFTQIPFEIVIALAVITAITLLFSLFNYYPVFRDIQTGAYDIHTESRVDSSDNGCKDTERK